MLHVWNGSRNRAWMGVLTPVFVVAGLADARTRLDRPRLHTAVIRLLRGGNQ
jgi:hypothetical protein